MTCATGLPRTGKGAAMCNQQEAERAIIGALLLSAENGDDHCATTVFDAVQAGDFSDPAFRSLFVAAERLHRDVKPLEHELWLAELKGNMPRNKAAALLLESVASVNTTATVGSDIDRVIEASRKRNAVVTVVDGLNDARRVEHHAELEVTIGNVW